MTEENKTPPKPGNVTLPGGREDRPSRLRRLLRGLWQDSRGQDLVEYGLLVTLIALGLTAAVDKFGCHLSCILEEAAVSIEKARGIIPPGQEKKCTRTCS